MSSDAYPVYDAIKARHGEVSSLRRAWLTLRSVVFWVWQILATFAMGIPVLLLSPFSFKLSYFFALSWIRLNRFILIDRTSGRNAVKQMVEQARDRIGKGRWLVIFPEGTRRPVGSEPRYRPGGAIVASQLGIQAIPVALNAGEFWPRMGFIKWPGTITVRIGKPIEGQGRTANQIMTEAESWIEANVQEMTWPRER